MRGAVSLMVLLLFTCVVVLLFWKAFPDPVHDVVLMVLGGLTQKMGTVVDFWLGSSDHKTELREHHD